MNPVLRELLGTLHQMGQLHVDKAVYFAANGGLEKVGSESMERFWEAVYGTTRLLGTYTRAILREPGFDLPEHVTRLLEALDKLHAACTEVSCDSISWSLFRSAIARHSL